MKLMTETQLLELLAKAYDQGHFDGTGPQAVTTEHRDTYEWHRGRACKRIMHMDAGGYDGKGKEVSRG